MGSCVWRLFFELRWLRVGLVCSWIRVEVRIFKFPEMIIENAYKASSRFRSSLTSTSIVLGYERTRVSVHGNEGSN
jgi:hypothetical protein